MKDKKGNYQLYPYRQITKDDEKPIRAFIFQKAGRTCIIYWHMNDTGQLTLDIEKNKLSLMNESGKEYLSGQQEAKVSSPRSRASHIGNRSSTRGSNKIIQKKHRNY